ncbi:unnamed protein product [Urochloa humidicola]
MPQPRPTRWEEAVPGKGGRSRPSRGGRRSGSAATARRAGKGPTLDPVEQAGLPRLASPGSREKRAVRRRSRTPPPRLLRRIESRPSPAPRPDLRCREEEAREGPTGDGGVAREESFGRRRRRAWRRGWRGGGRDIGAPQRAPSRERRGGRFSRVSM